MELYSEFAKQLVAVDCVIFGYDILKKELNLLLIKRSLEPALGQWSLAGGFVNENESLDEAAYRILYTLTGLNDVYLEQSHTYGEIKRDPGARVISTAYCALIKRQDRNRKLKEQNGANWQPLTRLPDLIFDHKIMVDRALYNLQIEIKVKPVGFALLPEKFTLVHLQELYEAIYQHQIDKRNFRKKILSMNILDKLDEKEKETSKKGAYYYRFNKKRYEILKQQGFKVSLDVN